MNSEHDDSRAGEDARDTAEEHGPERPARRSRLTVAAVTAAVLLAGGGGAWWAVAAGGDGGDSGTSARPAPLRIDGPDVPAKDASGAPGEVVLTGDATFTATGPLPKGPGSAPVYRPTGGVSQETVKKLAGLLGMTGTVVSDHGTWRVDDAADDAGPTLLVSKDAPGTWSYARYGRLSPDLRPDAPVTSSGSGDTGNASSSAAGSSTSSSASTASSGSSGSSGSPGIVIDTVTGPTTTGGAPVPEQKAKQAAAPVLDGLGLSGARIDAAQTAGALRLVTADPVVGGLPTHGWSTQLEVGADGRLAMGYGRLAPLGKGATYPVISAADAVEQLNASAPPADYGLVPCGADAPTAVPKPPVTTQTPPAPRTSQTPPTSQVPNSLPKPDATPRSRPYGWSATPTAPSDDKTMPLSHPCMSGNGHPTEIRGARFGLTMDFVSGTQTLVPAWLFDTAPAGVRGTQVVPETAVDPAYIQHGGAGQPSPAGPGGPARPTMPVNPSAPVNPGGPEVTDPGMPADPQAPRHVDVTAYRASGTTLTLTFWGGLCDTYKATAAETGTQVRVNVTAAPQHPGRMCPMIARSTTTTVQLKQPLGHRSVVDAKDGQPVRGQ